MLQCPASLWMWSDIVRDDLFISSKQWSATAWRSLTVSSRTHRQTFSIRPMEQKPGLLHSEAKLKPAFRNLWTFVPTIHRGIIDSEIIMLVPLTYLTVCWPWMLCSQGRDQNYPCWWEESWPASSPSHQPYIWVWTQKGSQPWLQCRLPCLFVCVHVHTHVCVQVCAYES